MEIREETPATIVSEVVDDLRGILRLEVALARAELEESMVHARRAAIFFGAAVAAASLGMLLLGLAATFALGLVMPMWAASLIVAAVLLGIAVVVAMIGRRQLRETDIVPHMAIDALQGLREEQWT